MLRALLQPSRRLLVAGRGLCTEAAPAAAPVVKEKHRWADKNLYEVLSESPKYGMGSKVFRNSWLKNGWMPDNYYFLITKTVLKYVSPTPPSP